jgi:hypothetical protein
MAGLLMDPRLTKEPVTIQPYGRPTGAVAREQMNLQREPSGIEIEEAKALRRCSGRKDSGSGPEGVPEEGMAAMQALQLFKECLMRC